MKFIFICLDIAWMNSYQSSGPVPESDRTRGPIQRGNSILQIFLFFVRKSSQISTRIDSLWHLFNELFFESLQVENMFHSFKGPPLCFCLLWPTRIRCTFRQICILWHILHPLVWCFDLTDNNNTLGLFCMFWGNNLERWQCNRIIRTILIGYIKLFKTQLVYKYILS